MKTVKVLAFPLLAFFLFFFFLYANSESEFFIWPSIDTKYAEDYDEKEFLKIKKGMTKNEVKVLVGNPLDVEQKGSISIWRYSRDGRFPFIDFAWLGRKVIFIDDQVSDVESRVYYD